MSPLRLRPWIAVAATATLGACGTSQVAPSVAPSEPEPQAYTGVFTVQEGPDHGPRLCRSVVTLRAAAGGSGGSGGAPACNGPDVHGWSWDDAEGETSDAGIVRGTYRVTGTWDGSALTLTEIPVAAALPGPGPGPDFTSPCEPPAGGWAVVDPATATNDDADAAMAYAESQPDWASAWSDPFDRSAEDPTSPEYGMVIFAKVVLNFRFTGDVERHEAALREIWGGALCVSKAPAPMDDLEAIQNELTDSIGMPNLVGVGVDAVSNVVDLEVFIDDGVQQSVDEQYGEGVVRVSAELTPVE